jgi:hypothetical protein
MLFKEVDMRAKMGAAGRRRAESEFSLERAADFWEKMLA